MFYLLLNLHQQLSEPQLNSNVGFDMKITLHRHPPPPGTQVNISPVPDPILTKH